MQKFEAKASSARHRLLPLAIGIVFVLMGIYILYASFILGITFQGTVSAGGTKTPVANPFMQVVLGIIFIVFGALPIFAANRGGKVVYYITEEGLLIERPIMHKRLFGWAEIADVREVSKDEVANMFFNIQMLEDGLRMGSFGSSANMQSNLAAVADIAMQRANLMIYAPAIGGIATYGGGRSMTKIIGMPVQYSYSPPTAIAAPIIEGRCILLETKGAKQEKFLLTPKNPDEFVSAVRAKISSS